MVVLGGCLGRRNIKETKEKMLSFIRRRLTVANGVLVITLVLAMSGGAYAASKILITSIKEISPKVVKQLKGERGPSGEKGAPGPEGKAGEKGTAGAEGKAGTTPSMKEFTGKSGSCNEGGVEFTASAGKDLACNGVKGTNGKEGETPVIKEFTGKSGNCNEGGVEFTTGAGKVLACNGRSAGGTLEKGKTERGTFIMTMTAAEKKGHHEGLAQITYPVPLVGSTLPTQIEVLGEKDTSANCAKSGPEATAAEGVLCVYIANSLPATGESGAPEYQTEFDNDPYGCVLEFNAESQASYLTGEWVLTAS
ncbi:MAG TPA: hypothetical protein VGP17_12730 [Solirubrobacteraceae bacterium]|nr:hypothetical protein [Solirubrobacteraceae bacterium]